VTVNGGPADHVMAATATDAQHRSDGSDHRITTLESGVRVVTERVPGVRSVALGFLVATGSAQESDEQAGISHLLEHMLFRGTERFGSKEIDEIFDAMGAEINAGTDKESTSLYTRVLDRHLERAFDVMGDMVWAPRFGELEAEREVVLEEIAMYEDDPQDHAERYGPERIVIAAAGSIEHDELLRLARSAEQRHQVAGAGGVNATPATPVPDFQPRLSFLEKDTEQYHVCLGGAGIARDDERRFALRVLEGILGGTSSSRLFQEIRERRGLAYSVFCYSNMYAATGEVGLYVGTRPENLEQALSVVAQELERCVRDPASEEELDRSRENLKGRMVLALESTGARMGRLGSAVLSDMPILSVNDVIERIDAVQIEHVRELAAELFEPSSLSLAGVGRSQEQFTAASAPLHGADLEQAAR